MLKPILHTWLVKLGGYSGKPSVLPPLCLGKLSFQDDKFKYLLSFLQPPRIANFVEVLRKLKKGNTHKRILVVTRSMVTG